MDKNRDELIAESNECKDAVNTKYGLTAYQEKGDGPGRGWWGPEKGGTHGKGGELFLGKATGMSFTDYHKNILGRDTAKISARRFADTKISLRTGKTSSGKSIGIAKMTGHPDVRGTKYLALFKKGGTWKGFASGNTSLWNSSGAAEQALLDSLGEIA